MRPVAVGNDVVDLRDPDSVADARHPRWDERVFTVAEQARVRRAEAEERVRWALWAAKEAAFKAARKLNPDVRFIPRDFAVKLLDDARAEVHHGLDRFHVWYEHARGWIHAAATPTEARPRWVVASLDEEEAPPGVRVRQVARQALASFLEVEPAELRVAMVEGVPAVLRGEEVLPVDLSLSHHGRLVACSWSVEGS